jgi:hypothetical protein
MSQAVSRCVCALALLLLPASALAKPFNNSDLFAGRSIKPDSKDRTFATGVHFQVAPVQAVIHTAVKKAVDSYTKDNPQAAAMTEYVKYVDTKKMKEIANKGDVEAYKKMMTEQMKARGVEPTPEQQKYMDSIDSDKLKTMAKLVEVYQSASKPAPTTTFSLEPYATLNLNWLQLTAQLPIAGFHNDAGNSFELGNLGLDLRTGGSLGPNGLAFGWTVGASFYAPTGTADSDTIALSNVLATPRYRHSYFSSVPYVVLGAELAVIKVTARAEYVDMQPAAKSVDDKLFGAPKHMAYLDYGAGVLADLGLVGISAEVDGLAEMDNAPFAKNVFLGTFGLRAFLGPVQAGAAVQMPFLKPVKQADSLTSTEYGDLADFNVLVNAQFKF